MREDNMFRSRICSKRLLGSAGFLGVLLSATASVDASLAAPSATAPKATCTSLVGLSLPNVKIISATEVTTFTPNYCSVVGVIDKRVSTQDPDHFTYGIGFRLNLPDTWIGRFEVQGGGGTDGSLGSALGNAGVELSEGWAVAADDGGHEDRTPNPFGWMDDDANAGGSAHFGIDAQARTDYGYEGIAATTVISELIIEHYYGKPVDYTYLAGCSNGGRDGMVASQRFPELFDGIISGNPGFDLPRAAVAEVWNEQVLGPLATRA